MKFNGVTSLLDNRDVGCSCRCIRNYTSSPSKFFKCCCYVLVVFLIVELLIFNIICIYGYALFQIYFAPILNKEGVSLMDKLAENEMVKDFVERGKVGGFISLLQNTIERVYVQYPQSQPQMTNAPFIASLGLDVSDSGEALYIYNRFLRRKSFPYDRLVVDIGANDGLMSSNSFNFIQWGWNAVLVEPQFLQLEMAKRNIQRYNDPFRDGNATVKFVQGVIGKRDGLVDFVRSHDIASMEGHILAEDSSDEVPFRSVITINSQTVKTFTSAYDIPKYFGLLSIDAEGHGNVILHDFIDLGFRPAYIIYEDLHEKRNEATTETVTFLSNYGYRFLTRRGWNCILEHNMED